MRHNPDRLLVVRKADVLVLELQQLAYRHQRPLAETSPGLRRHLLRASRTLGDSLREACEDHSPTRAAERLAVAISALNRLERLLTLVHGLRGAEVPCRRLIDEARTIRAMACGFRTRVLGGET